MRRASSAADMRVSKGGGGEAGRRLPGLGKFKPGMELLVFVLLLLFLPTHKLRSMPLPPSDAGPTLPL